MDADPVPCMDRMLEKIGRAAYITNLDLTKGYWQISLEKSTVPKIRFY